MGYGRFYVRAMYGLSSGYIGIALRATDAPFHTKGDTEIPRKVPRKVHVKENKGLWGDPRGGCCAFGAPAEGRAKSPSREN